jgi:hypothetical protein
VGLLIAMAEKAANCPRLGAGSAPAEVSSQLI